MVASAPSDNAMFARISAVQHRMGASRFTLASPVESPTFSGPNSRHSAIHFSFTSAFTGQVYTDFRPRAIEWNSIADATSDFPEPVGVFRMTFFPEKISRTASSWAGYNVTPRSSWTSRKRIMSPSSSISSPRGRAFSKDACIGP